MSEAPVSKHVFISYVREDAEKVDSLCRVLEAAQIPYWRDRSALGPGQAWKAKIRQAIRDGSLMFLACFSDSSRAKDKSYMNEELTLAADEFRLRPPDREWLIPVRFDAGEVPHWDLGAGRSINDLNYSNLFGDGHAAEAAKLVTTIHRVMGEKRLDTASTVAAIEQATNADRTDLVKRLTKEMLLDPTRQIELDDLVTREAQRVLSVLKDPDRVSGPLGGSAEEQVIRVATEAQELCAIAQPFCASLHAATRWANPTALTPWSNGIRAFVQAATKIEGGAEALLRIRHVPGLIALMTAGVGCVASDRWANLKTLVVDPYVRDRYQEQPLSLLEATHPYAPFDDQGWVSSSLARAAQRDVPVADAFKKLKEDQVKLHTPVADWLFAVLRPVLADHLPDDDMYAAAFDRAEVMLGVLAQDAVNLRRASSNDGQIWGSSHWFGRSTWRSAHSFTASPVRDLQHELATQGGGWAPLSAGLFGEDPERAKTALDEYAEDFGKVARSRF
ncbi:toll/interleukin-1 receptor domain-containing protein [Luteipulveratus flavus]|uniref:Toll/interleukin-1 receptor domain-containing protein n=1 Tax=Luteipulveratus flavus TaxID=3031728 RepID=A0ABT6C2N4_9MICO|nr:toll/interleukin-1 receptor domain-containing protein [Luteipulveratus sp. YIM 133296]MDF8263209.1 toll/interleukin-1 receptor domain-containing protein [Luteipulveratus sp. YIM 133296]